MKEQYGPAMQVFEGLKKTLDPNGIMIRLSWDFNLEGGKEQ